MLSILGTSLPRTSPPAANEGDLLLRAQIRERSNLDRLNLWLTPLANVALLAGLVLVAYELNQKRSLARMDLVNEGNVVFPSEFASYVDEQVSNAEGRDSYAYWLQVRSRLLGPEHPATAPTGCKGGRNQPASYAAPTVPLRFEPLEPSAAPSPSVYLWLHVGAGLERLFETYRERGVRIVQAPVDRRWGVRQFIIQDCNGYLISFSAEPSA